MSTFAGKESYSFLAVSMCKTTEERLRDERKGNWVTTMFAKKLARKIVSVLRLASRSSLRQSTLVFNDSMTYSDRDESDQCKYLTSESERLYLDTRRPQCFA